MAEYDGITSYRKVGLRRLADALELLQPPSLNPNEAGAERRHLRAAIYLAGYAVEVVLKAYIISKTSPAETLADAMVLLRARGVEVPDLLSSQGHQLNRLLSLTDLETQIEQDKRLKQHWTVCQKWKSTWRYDHTVPSESFSQEFVEAAIYIHRWVERQLIIRPPSRERRHERGL